MFIQFKMFLAKLPSQQKVKFVCKTAKNIDWNKQTFSESIMKESAILIMLNSVLENK